MKQLIEELNKATKAYDKGRPYITDKKWDEMYFELMRLEKETGFSFPNSPTHSIPFEVVTELKKIEHNHPMLSLDKTKDINVIESFLKGHDWIIMAKMDGLTCSLRYLNGELISAETRGDGKIGEDILHNAKVIFSIPKHIDFKEELVVDGEIICTYSDFEEFKEKYKNPRNFAAGSIRLLDSKECYNRKLTFVAWDVIKGGKYEWLSNNLSNLRCYGFEVAPMFINDPKDGDSIEDYINAIKSAAKQWSYPIDGVVFKYDSIKEYNDMGHTDHHYRGGLAYKFYDEIYETYLTNIEWSMGRTGILTPVAIFEPIEINGSTVSRASLHNISIMNEVSGGVQFYGDKIWICKRNEIIPNVEQWEHKGDLTVEIPKVCPYCGAPTKIKKDINTEILYCSNNACNGQLINRIDHFCGKKGLDIKGLSKATLEKLIDWGWIEKISDIFTLWNYKDEWIQKPGFGAASVNRILNAIKESRKCTTDKFICALGIPLIGRVASKALVNKFGNYLNFKSAIDNENRDALFEIDGIGDIMIEELLKFDYTNADLMFHLYIKEIETAAAPSTNDNELEGKVFVITGKLKSYKNREALKTEIESKGGKVTSSVTKNTTYLINNNSDSETSKNLTAKKLGIPIITEEEFQTLITLKPSYLTSAT